MTKQIDRYTEEKEKLFKFMSFIDVTDIVKPRALRGFIQLITEPFYSEKTEHGVSKAISAQAASSGSKRF